MQPTQQPKDYFVHRDGQVYAGTHLIVDLWGASQLDDLATVEHALR
ncbi:MAG: adenosylmethionine decarboxylase, partial [Rhodospirillales bacterium]